MAGMYIHIPFCKQACTYCNFHFSTSSKNRKDIVKAICRELETRSAYLEGEVIKSIYFGGGTPSILDSDDIRMIFDAISQNENYDLDKLAEVTLEANPDDLSEKKLKELKASPINRLSIGIQSFHQEDLNFMNRAHKAEDGIIAIKRAQDAGFKNLTIDLIYGVPSANLSKWESNLKQFFDLDIPHLSSYALTLEENTVYHHLVKKGKVSAPDEDALAEQYELLQEYIIQNEWTHYELSNYCKGESEAIHNSAYWSGDKYLGVGPSAHSFDGKSRQWNIANNSLYLKADFNSTSYFEKEKLSIRDIYHDLLISRLRTSKGLNISELSTHCNKGIAEHFKLNVEAVKDYFNTKNDQYSIKEKYWLTSDNIIRRLMLDD